MSLHPSVESILSVMRAQPTVHPRSLTMTQRRREYREMALAMWPHPTHVAEVRDVTFELSTGQLGARLYVPIADAGHGLLLFFHGGSFVVGDLDTHDGICRRLALDTGMRVLAVDYRLAPEHPFPAAVDDAVGALRHVGEHLSTYAEPTARIIVVGDSAGAPLAAVAASATRQEQLAVAGQVLIYPTLGPEVLTRSAHEYATGYLLELEHLRFDYEQYLAGWRDHTDPRVSPLMSLDLTDSVPAVVVVAQFDPLRDEALSYAGLLEHFGTPVEILEAEGMVHGFLRLGGVVPDALSILDNLATHLRRLVEVGAQ